MPPSLRWRTESDTSGFVQPLLLIRWGTTTISVVLAAPQILDGSLEPAGWAIVLTAYTILRTFFPIRSDTSVARTVALVAEALLSNIAVIATGYFLSPFAFSALPVIAAAGFGAGFAVAIRLAITIALAIGIPMLIQSDDAVADRRTATQWAVELVLVALVTGYARRILSDAADERREAQAQLDRLGDANELLVRLHDIAQDLPTSLDLDGVLDSTLLRARELLGGERIIVLLHDRADGQWRIARTSPGTQCPAPTSDIAPLPIRHALESDTAIVGRPDLPGGLLSDGATSGVYGILRARGVVVGAVAVETVGPAPMTAREADLLDRLIGATALAVDNALWFSRLRTVGAAEERSRIARDLHDRIGQSLAYLAFELDRVARLESDGVSVSSELVDVRQYLRSVVREVRDTLYDLRSEVSDETTFAAVATDFARQVEARSGKTVLLRMSGDHRPGTVQERELWRIAREAIVNAERHSEGQTIEVRWTSTPTSTMVEVQDNGHGMPTETPRQDSYGIIGMRERAASIGATLHIDSSPETGVVVRTTLPVRS